MRVSVFEIHRISPNVLEKQSFDISGCVWSILDLIEILADDVILKYVLRLAEVLLAEIQAWDLLFLFDMRKFADVTNLDL